MKIVPIILALALALAVIACEKKRRSSDEQGALESKVALDVRQRAGEKRYAPAIVRLNIPADLTAMSSAQRAAAIARVTEGVARQVSSKDVRVVHHYSFVPIMAVWANEEGLADLAMLDEVREIVLDRVEQSSLDQSTRQIQAHVAWAASTGSDQLVAVLDMGTDYLHPFLGQRIPIEACFRRDKKCRNNSYEHFGQGAARSLTRDHGMHVAGIAAGANGPLAGGAPLNGVAPGAKIIAINIFSTDGAYVGDQVKALEYVATLREGNVRVVAANLSLGNRVKHLQNCDSTEKDRKPIIDRLYGLGVATVVAAGNEAYINGVSAPGCIRQAVTVSSVNDNDLIHQGHNRSSLTDFMAPGVAIRSSLPKAVYGGPSDYGNMSGTSMAAPHVSGAIALLAAAAPQKTLPEILGALTLTAKPIHETPTGITYRRIDVNKALVHLQSH